MIKGGPRVVTDGLIYCLDAASVRGVSKAGCMGFNNADQLIKNLLSLSDTITTSTDLRLGNLNFYTLYAISYPEWNYSPANRDGITPGFNDTSSSKLLDFSRDLNYAVWDNATNSWVADSYFNGERIGGHCYDTYDGVDANSVSEHTNFQNDYYNIVANFPDATHIVVGSHAAENHDANSTTLAILQDLGGPSSWPGGRPEYILVGKPGLGADNAYIWQYENDNAQVAHANVGLPILGRKSSGGNYLDFNGSSDKADLDIRTIDGLTTYSISFWVNFDTWSTGSTYGNIYCEETGLWIANYYDKIGFDFHNGNTWIDGNGGTVDSLQITVPASDKTGTWLHVTATYSGSTSSTSATITGYLNGSQNFQVTTSYASGSNSRIAFNGSTNYKGGIGYRRYYNSYYFNGKIANMSMYNKVLTSAEVLSNYNATKGRFS